MSQDDVSNSHLVTHLFRHEYGQLVASLSKRVGLAHLALVEEAVQDAMEAALASWPINGEPEKPTAWLYKVAYRKLISEFRLHNRRHVLLVNLALCLDDEQEREQERGLAVPLLKEMNDDLLGLLFITCDQSIPEQSQLVFTLKSLCGFNIKEIAQRLFITQANVYKRFNRAKVSLKQRDLDVSSLTDTQLDARLPNVLKVLYLIFTEGYLSSHPESAIRIDLCEEAIHLSQILVMHPVGQTPQTQALLALMFFHLARMNSRQEEDGSLLLLAQQDRLLWHQGHIRTAMQYLMASAQGETLSRYHLEASIACEHCLAPSIETTNWPKIIAAYTHLEKIEPSALQVLNRAIALSHHEGPEAALELLATRAAPSWLIGSYYWYAVKADLLFQLGRRQTGKAKAKSGKHKTGKPQIVTSQAAHTELAQDNAQKALESAPTEQIKQALIKRFKQYETPN